MVDKEQQEPVSRVVDVLHADWYVYIYYLLNSLEDNSRNK